MLGSAYFAQNYASIICQGLLSGVRDLHSSIARKMVHNSQPFLSYQPYTGLVSRASPFTNKEGSGTAPLLELFCWNAINITRATCFYASLAHCGDKLTAHRACVQQARCAVARVVHAYIPRSCRSHKICIFMFPRISGEKNNSSNDAVPDPSFFVKGLARETNTGLYSGGPSYLGSY